jgi:hypothetical protein
VPDTIPLILIIDDKEADGEALEAELVGAQVRTLTRVPDEIAPEDLVNADLIVVDFQLEDWDERDQLRNPGLRPLNGLALIEVLRSHVGNGRPREGRPPVGFVLFSASDRFPSVGRAEGQRADHLIARLTNLDWFVRKGGNPLERRATVLSLAHGFSQLPKVWPLDPAGSTEEFHRLLALPTDKDWEQDAWRDILSCYPPLHGDLTPIADVQRDCTPFVRWLSQRILPYPTCLWSIQEVSAYLRVEVPVLRTIIEDGTSELAHRLDECGYRGIFEGLLGRRWWKAGVAALLWKLTNGEPFLANSVNEGISRAAGINAGTVSGSPVVPVMDSSLAPTDALLPIEEAVRVQLDEWPSYASLPWIPTALALEEPDLAAYVFLDDRARLDEANT